MITASASGQENPMIAVEPGSAGVGDARRCKVHQVYRELAGSFRRAGLCSPNLDARLLVCHACDMSHEAFIAEPARWLSASELVRLEIMTERRLRREPVSRILGQKEFWSLPFIIAPATLDPRPDTELVVESVLEIVRNSAALERNLKVLDLGTGCGCILLSVLRELKQAAGVGIDRNELALRTASKNALALGVAGRASFAAMDWLGGLSGAFDIIVSNPPYIRRDTIPHLAPEVALYDPEHALDGGRDGLAAYRAIIPFLKDVIARDGWAVFEVGEAQAEIVLEMMNANGFAASSDLPAIHHDLCGHARVVLGQRCN
ncbi:release factor glutamine methyltransferase [bacterium MnTg02]|nr:release factor glutamine methyltransferase [bacterium MnTg02]